MKLFLIILISSYFSFSCEKDELIKEDISQIENASYYVAPNGDDNNPGSFEKPFKSWGKAIKMVKPGELIYLRGGKYYSETTYNLAIVIDGINGEPGKYIRLWAYPREIPILDCSTMSYEQDALKGIRFTGSYWHFKGIHVTGIHQPLNGAYCRAFSVTDSYHNIFENLDIHDNESVGLYMGEGSSDNLIVNCDFHDNFDPYSMASEDESYAGGRASGCHISVREKGTVNTVKGCRFWYNSDSGFDAWKCEGIVNIDSCWSFWNGYIPGTFEIAGDGQGFKLGGTDLPMDNFPQRIVRNCIAYANQVHGYDQNGAEVLMVFHNNTAFENGGLGFYLLKYPLKNIYKNNIAYRNHNRNYDNTQVRLNTESDQTNNSWNGIIVTDGDFQSLDYSQLTAKRNSNGSLPAIEFLKLNLSSPLIDKGIDVGLPYLGNAPDLGAFEAK